MSGVVPEFACRKRLRSCDNAKKNLKSDDDEDEVKNRMIPAAFFEKEKKKKRLNNANSEKNSKVSATLFGTERKKEKLNKINSKKKMMADDQEREESKVRNDHNMVKNRKVCTAFFEKEKKRKRLKNTNIENLQSDDNEKEVKMCNCDSKVKNGKVSATFFEKEKKKKILGSDNAKKKTNDKKRNTPLSFSKNKMQNNDSKKTAPIIYAVKEKNMRPSQSTEIKMRHNGKQKKRNVPSGISKEKKMQTLSDSNYQKRKRVEPHTLFKKEKWMQFDHTDKKTRTDKVKEKKICGDGKEKKRKEPFAFFKFICNNFEEFLLIPPMVTCKLENLTNHHVYLEDAEGKCSKIRLSVVDGYLAFHQGWNMFVSDHLIKWGEFLLFEYTAKSTFSVRVFGKDSLERLHFNVERERKGVKEKHTWSNMSPDDLVSFDGNSEDIDDDHYLFGEYPRRKVPETHHVTVEGPKNVECGVGSGPEALDKKNGNLVNRQCKTKGISPLRSQEKTVILITDSEPSTHENENIMKLTASEADSDTHHVAFNTNEDPRILQSGVGNGPSVVLDDKKGPDAQRESKCTSPTCSKAKTRRSEITNAAPSTHENGKKVKHVLELHDSDEDLRTKQEINSIRLEPTTSMEKYYNNSKMNISQNICRKYEAHGGFLCLEKWRKGIVTSGRAALDGTGLIKPENPQKTDSQLVGDYDAIGLNPVDKCFWSEGTHACVQPIFTMPVKEPSSPDRVSICGHGGTEIDHSIDGKGAAVQLQTKKEQLKTVGSIVNSQRNNIPACANPVVAGNHGAIGLNPVGSEGTCAFVESVLTMPVEKSSSPDRISKCGSSRTEIDHNADGKGSTVQLETKMNQLKPVGGIVSSQSTNILVCANHVVASQSEHCFSKQKDRKSTDCVISVSLMPMKAEILELDDRSLLKINLQFCIPNTTRKWLELPKSLSNALRQRRQDQNVIMLKDPLKRLWPVLYHENSVFVGFTAGWKHFVAANNLQTGDLCELFKEPDDEEPVYSVQITKK
ncbi:B3 domain-containing protein Os02g0598200-like isoform X1 [Phragmites australis]|uniref:B3 domain-containing protein Os02g0598200-like isoform X1 n=1 Tax=Phragmites australis TaxID=29695 RepID=UPI002D788D69|nr:B3 domain-containing protein Os02g0598200-like isoform X1 [Phragmites australis]XP_062219538.1 B3 domain-containing protein Os02g0598200-like isoform X1 [Phragmites australis]XP_062219539.1 B3 domain-containing protein Os02g0598200-like isoform X1 [Phragmites australis]